MFSPDGLLEAIAVSWLYRGLHYVPDAIGAHEGPLHAFLLGVLAHRAEVGGPEAASALVLKYLNWCRGLPHAVCRDARLCLLRLLPKFPPLALTPADAAPGLHALRSVMADQLHFENSAGGRDAIRLTTLAAACRCVIALGCRCGCRFHSTPMVVSLSIVPSGFSIELMRQRLRITCRVNIKWS